MLSWIAYGLGSSLGVEIRSVKQSVLTTLIKSWQNKSEAAGLIKLLKRKWKSSVAYFALSSAHARVCVRAHTPFECVSVCLWDIMGS